MTRAFFTRKARRFLCTLLAAIWLGPLAAHASEEPLKRLIVDDCKAALEKLETTPLVDQQQLIPYLRLVLHLNLRDIPDEMVVPGMLGDPTFLAPGIDARQPASWKSFNPSPESESQSCALYILSQLAHYALPALADIVTLAEDPQTPELLRELSIRTADEIAAAHRDELQLLVFVQPLAQLFELFSSARSQHAGRLMLALGGPAIPYLLGELERCAAPLCADIAELLSTQAKPEQLAASQHVLRRLLAAQASDVRIATLRIVGHLNTIDSELFFVLLQQSEHPESGVRRATLKAIAALLKHMGTQLLTDTGTTLLAHALLHNSEKEAKHARALLLEYPALAAAEEDPLALLASTGPTPLRLDALRILATFPVQRGRSFQTLLDAAYDSDPLIAAQGIRALAGQTLRSKEVLATFSKMLKRLNAKSEEQAALAITIAACTPQLPASEQLASLAPYFVDALALSALSPQDQQALEAALQRTPTAAQSALRRALKSKNPVLAERAQKVLERVP